MRIAKENTKNVYRIKNKTETTKQKPLKGIRMQKKGKKIDSAKPNCYKIKTVIFIQINFLFSREANIFKIFTFYTRNSDIPKSVAL